MPTTQPPVGLIASRIGRRPPEESTPAARRVAGLFLEDQVFGDQVGRDPGDCGRAEPRTTSDLGPRDRAVRLDDVQDVRPVERAHQITVAEGGLMHNGSRPGCELILFSE